MIGYIYITEQAAIDARAQAATYKGLPNPQGDTLYWVNYNYSNLDSIYYIQYVDGLENVLGAPIEFTITIPILE
jgi:hypothetical protein